MEGLPLIMEVSSWRGGLTVLTPTPWGKCGHQVITSDLIADVVGCYMYRLIRSLPTGVCQSPR